MIPSKPPLSPSPTSFLMALKPTLDFTPSYHLAHPLILIGPGTGVAPFMGFLDHRRNVLRQLTDSRSDPTHGIWRGTLEVHLEPEEARNKQEMEDGKIDQDFVLFPSKSKMREEMSIGETVLFFGCRHEDRDWIYKREMEEFLGDGTLSHLFTAFSRDTPEKVYVQHKMSQEGGLLRKLVVQKEGSVFVCGDGARMARWLNLFDDYDYFEE